jgi:hypothetical protein
MGYRLKYEKGIMPQIPFYPSNSTGLPSNIAPTDEEKLVTLSSNLCQLMIGSTADIAKASGILGIVAVVPTATTPGSTSYPVWIQPLSQYDVVEADYSTTYERSTTFNVLTTNIGSFFGVSNTTTIVGAQYLDPSVVGTAAGTTSALFFRMLGFSTQRGVMWGIINSSHLALS